MWKVSVAVIFLACTAVASPLVCNGTGQCVYESDGVPWKLETDQAVIAVGDIHGQVDILKGIYQDYGLLESPKALLIQVGDLVDRGPSSKRAMDFARVQKQSFFLLGNHDVDLLKGITWGLSDEDLADFRVEFSEHAHLDDQEFLSQIFTTDTPYARWIASRNAIMQINDTLFTHAYVPQALEYFNPGQMNATVRKWLRFRLGLEPQPDSRTEWVFGPDGPFNNTRLVAPEYRGHLPQIFQKYDVSRVVMGHVRKPGAYAKGITLDHHTPQVILIDTGMDAGGVASSLVLTANVIAAATHPSLNCQDLLSM